MPGQKSQRSLVSCTSQIEIKQIDEQTSEFGVERSLQNQSEEEFNKIFRIQRWY